MSRNKRLAIDLALTASMPILAIWIYEASNLAVLALQGARVTLAMSGWIPMGVAGVSQGAISPLTKPAQVLIAVSLLVPLAMCLSRTRLVVARAFLVSIAGVFVASAYWEWLSQLAYVSQSVHLAVFLATSGAVSFVLLRAFSNPRYLRARLQVIQN